jgi:hypothetical protein
VIGPPWRTVPYSAYPASTALAIRSKGGPGGSAGLGGDDRLGRVLIGELQVGLRPRFQSLGGRDAEPCEGGRLPQP